ncbi:MAG: serine hydrolase [Candidatus Kerfeldbacteria bacterium]|nr:serine hydrolase [Candidatus Kerfeldbacteria bacterium]
MPLYLIGLTLTSVWLLGFGGVVEAAESTTLHFDPSLIRWGKTLALPNGARAGIFPNTLPRPADVTWARFRGPLPSLPDHRAQLGAVYSLSIHGVEHFTADQPRPLAVAIPFGSSYWIRQVWVYDLDQQQWFALPTSLDRDHRFGQATTRVLRGLYVILEDRQQQEGLASWYCRLACSSRYPRFHAASNDWPLGTVVRVRSLETGRTADVTVVSRWGQPVGRIIDLSWSAYAALGTSNVGVTRVNVGPPRAAQVLGAVTSSVRSKADVMPPLKVVGNNGLPFPSIAARPFAVFDQISGQLLAGHRTADQVPIASITKLMTAAVFLDLKPSLRTTFTYQATDDTPFGYLRVSAGETMQLRDLFYAMLVGSANNAATALARSTGLSREQFIERMNNKAQAWGLSLTRFVDVTGLDPGNVSTAEEVARLAAQVFHEYEPIRYVTTRRVYHFRTLNTGLSHTIPTTDWLLGRGLVDRQLIFTGGKTGYLDEAKYTYVIRTADRTTGSQVVVAIMGSASSRQRFVDAAAVINWAFRNHRWES